MRMGTTKTRLSGRSDIPSGQLVSVGAFGFGQVFFAFEGHFRRATHLSLTENDWIEDSELITATIAELPCQDYFRSLMVTDPKILHFLVDWKLSYPTVPQVPH